MPVMNPHITEYPWRGPAHDHVYRRSLLGTMAALISMLIWGRWLVDLIAAGT
jgi:hypothetical protein